MDIDNAAVRSLSQRLDRLEAQVALHRLAHEYCIGADERDRDLWAAVWTPDASWETSPDRTFTGVQNICAAVQAQWDAFPIMQHATSNHVVDIEGDHASGRADVTVMVQLGDGRWSSAAPPMRMPTGANLGYGVSPTGGWFGPSTSLLQRPAKGLSTSTTWAGHNLRYDQPGPAAELAAGRLGARYAGLGGKRHQMAARAGSAGIPPL